MSSQSLNATTYSGYQLIPTASATPGAGTLPLSNFPARDASDVTRLIRERVVYTEFKSGSPISPGNTENPWIKYANGIRLSYLFGRVQCGACTPAENITGNAFSANGISTS